MALDSRNFSRKLFQRDEARWGPRWSWPGEATRRTQLTVTSPQGERSRVNLPGKISHVDVCVYSQRHKSCRPRLTRSSKPTIFDIRENPKRINVWIFLQIDSKVAKCVVERVKSKDEGMGKNHVLSKNVHFFYTEHSRVYEYDIACNCTVTNKSFCFLDSCERYVHTFIPLPQIYFYFLQPNFSWYIHYIACTPVLEYQSFPAF